MGGLEHLDGAQAHQGGAGVGVGMAHHHGQAALAEPIEGEGSLGQYLAQLGVVLLARALLLRLPRIAVVQARLLP